MEREWLKQARKKENLTQIKLGKMSGCSGAYINQLESGVRNPSVSIAQKISKVLNLDWTFFFTNKTNKTLVRKD
ncbi:helix-turn-helix transcriptional regulator [Vallitalea maricola]|uniref:Uncharacterized protein n=1 Tax=Vallitalea maricola TaxID=3074433 RepID=A0ACB5URM5_9FIRM|nr:hypothetical protein AN2V17_45160 [Vallitalea sp. AN17-2]